MRIKKSKLKHLLRRVILETRDPRNMKIVPEYEDLASVIKRWGNEDENISRFLGVYMTDDDAISMEFRAPEVRKYVNHRQVQQMGEELQEKLSDYGTVKEVRASRGDDLIEVNICFLTSETDEEGYLLQDSQYQVPWTKAHYDELAKYLGWQR